MCDPALLRTGITERLWGARFLGVNRACAAVLRQAIPNIGHYPFTLRADNFGQPDFVPDNDLHCGVDRQTLRCAIRQEHHASMSEIEDARLEYSSRRIVYHPAGLHGPCSVYFTNNTLARSAAS